MDEELKTFLVGMESRLASMVSGEIRASEARLGGHITEKIHCSETRLLSEFWKWARNNDLRVGRLDQSDASTVARVSSLEERVFTLERKFAGSPG